MGVEVNEASHVLKRDSDLCSVTKWLFPVTCSGHPYLRGARAIGARLRAALKWAWAKLRLVREGKEETGTLSCVCKVSQAPPQLSSVMLLASLPRFHHDGFSPPHTGSCGTEGLPLACQHQPSHTKELEREVWRRGVRMAETFLELTQCEIGGKGEIKARACAVAERGHKSCAYLQSAMGPESHSSSQVRHEATDKKRGAKRKRFRKEAELHHLRFGIASLPLFRLTGPLTREGLKGATDMHTGLHSAGPCRALTSVA